MEGEAAPWMNSMDGTGAGDKPHLMRFFLKPRSHRPCFCCQYMLTSHNHTVINKQQCAICKFHNVSDSALYGLNLNCGSATTYDRPPASRTTRTRKLKRACARRCSTIITPMIFDNLETDSNLSSYHEIQHEDILDIWSYKSQEQKGMKEWDTTNTRTAPGLPSSQPFLSVIPTTRTVLSSSVATYKGKFSSWPFERTCSKPPFMDAFSKASRASQQNKTPQGVQWCRYSRKLGDVTRLTPPKAKHGWKQLL